MRRAIKDAYPLLQPTGLIEMNQIVWGNRQVYLNTCGT